jgi:methyl-accepting chemotaxis protein
MGACDGYAEKELQEPINKLVLFLLGGGLLGLAILIMSIVFFSRYLTGHIRRANEMAARIADWDLTHRIEVTTSDEFGQMGSLPIVI